MWLDRKYVSLLSSSLPLFKETGDGVFNFRCVICGDSTTNPNKTRGYLLQKDGKYFSYCHNCHVSMPFHKFLEHINPILYEEYLEEKLVKKPRRQVEKTKLDLKFDEAFNIGIPSVMWLDLDHPARAYLDGRKIASRWHPSLFYAENFNAFANEHIPNKYDPSHAEARIVVPMRTRSGKLMGFQGRAIVPQAKIRYITGILAPDNPKIFNLDLVDLNATNYCTEGIFDSMHLKNAIAALGSDLISATEKAQLNTSKTVFVYDNEPRNKDIIRQMNKAIRGGYKIAIWPKGVIEKDINDMVLSGVDVETVLRENTFQGLEAEMQLGLWRR